MANRGVQDAAALSARPAAWVEVGLTLPIFVLYHVGIVFLDVRNGADFLTQQLMHIANGDPLRYLGLTLAIGVACFGVFAYFGRGQVLVPRKFAQMVVEGAVYAFAMAIVGSRAVTSLFAGFTQSSLQGLWWEPLPGLPQLATAGEQAMPEGRFTGFVMSLGAGFYEELVFRVLLFGVGLKLVLWLLVRQQVGLFGPERRRWSWDAVLITLGWAVLCAAVFSGIHYVGDFADAFSLPSFVYRFVLGLALTLVFVTRGFAVAVWTHALYDIWVMVLAPN